VTFTLHYTDVIVITVIVTSYSNGSDGQHRPRARTVQS